MSPDELRKELGAKRLDELRGLARGMQVPGYSAATKAQLVERLLQVDGAALGRLIGPTAPNGDRDRDRDRDQSVAYQPAA